LYEASAARGAHLTSANRRPLADADENSCVHDGFCMSTLSDAALDVTYY